jgi:hypothetical protein
VNRDQNASENILKILEQHLINQSRPSWLCGSSSLSSLKAIPIDAQESENRKIELQYGGKPPIDPLFIIDLKGGYGGLPQLKPKIKIQLKSHLTLGGFITPPVVEFL